MMDIHIGRRTEVVLLLTVIAAAYLAAKKGLERLQGLSAHHPM